MSVKTDIKETIKALKNLREFKSQEEVAAHLGYNRSYFSRVMGGEIPMDFEEKFFKAFPKNKYLNSGIIEEPMKVEIYNITDERYSDKKFTKKVIVIPAKAQLGLRSYLFPEEMLNDLQTKQIFVDEDYHGRYYEIECIGNSMKDGSRTSIEEGDYILCREISKLHWREPFHKNNWEFVFFHNEKGIIIKVIKEQDLETGDLLLSSYNPNKEEYPDFTINIRDCYSICDVVQVTQNRHKF